MISPASNCSRVDAVKASANQLKQRLAQIAATPDDSDTRAAGQQLQAVDVQLKSNDANKAELALSTAKAAIEKLTYHHQDKPKSSSTAAYGSVDIHA